MPMVINNNQKEFEEFQKMRNSSIREKQKLKDLETALEDLRKAVNKINEKLGIE